MWLRTHHTSEPLKDVPAEKRSRHIVATYDYVDEDSQFLCQVVRFEPNGFAQRRPDGKGGWIWNMKGIRRVIYRLPDIVGGPAEATIYVEEGEKDVEALRSLGVLTTCNPGGVGKFTRDLTDPLKGRHVVIIADRDEPGRFDAEQVAATP